MSVDDPHAPHAHIPLPGEPSVPELEEDESIPPRPEEPIADALRAAPDTAPHPNAARVRGMAEDSTAAPENVPASEEDASAGIHGAIVPQDAHIAHALAPVLGVYVEDDGRWDPPADPLNLELFRAVVALESRVLAAEERLKNAGH